MPKKFTWEFDVDMSGAERSFDSFADRAEKRLLHMFQAQNPQIANAVQDFGALEKIVQQQGAAKVGDPNFQKQWSRYQGGNYAPGDGSGHSSNNLSAEERSRNNRQRQDNESRQRLMQQSSFTGNLSRSLTGGSSGYQFGQLAQGSAGPMAGTFISSAYRSVAARAALAAGGEGSMGGLALGGAASGIGLALAAVFGMDNAVTKRNVDQYNLSASLGKGGLTQGGSSLLHNLTQLSSNYNYSTDQGLDVARGLGNAGVRSSDVMGATQASLAFAREAAIDPNQAGSLTGTLMVQGGQGLNGVIKTFQQLSEQAQKSNVPLSRMVNTFQSFQQATNGMAINVNGLAAVQSRIGGVNAGQLVAPLMGATGASAIGFAGMLGLNIEQFSALQNAKGGADPAKFMDLTGSFIKRITGGRNTAANRAKVETLLQGAGVLDLSHANAQQQATLSGSLITGNTGAFSQTESAIAAGEKNIGAHSWETNMMNLSKSETGILTQIFNAVHPLADKLVQLSTDLHMFLQPIANTAQFLSDLATHFGMKQTHGGQASGGSVSNPLTLVSKIDQALIGAFGSAMLSDNQSSPLRVKAQGLSAQQRANFMHRSKIDKLLMSGKNHNLFTMHSPNGGSIGLGSNLYGMLDMAASHYGIPTDILIAQAAKESNLDPTVPGGGLGQFDAATWKRFGKGKMSDPLANAAAMARYDRYLLNLNHGNVKGMLEMYKAGENYPRNNGGLMPSSAVDYAQKIQNNAKIEVNVHLKDIAGRELGSTSPHSKRTVKHGTPAPGTRHHGPTNPHHPTTAWDLVGGY